MQFSRTLRLGSVAGSGFGPGSELGRFLSKATLQAVLASHFSDKKLKVCLVSSVWSVLCSVRPFSALRNQCRFSFNNLLAKDPSMSKQKDELIFNNDEVYQRRKVRF